MQSPSKTQEQNITALYPKNEAPKVIGRLIYSESHQSWNTIRIRKEIIQKFPQLREKTGNFIYKMNMYDSYKNIVKELSSMEKNKEAIPILLMLCRCKSE